MAGDGSSMRSGVVRRRHDRLVQEERRRQAAEQQQQPEEMQQDYHHRQEQQYQGEASIEVGYLSDAFTMTSSTIISGGCGASSAALLRSPASSTRSTNSSSNRRLSAARQNMMQRRIEARKRHEERQREQMMLQQQQQQPQPQHVHVTTGQPQHSVQPPTLQQQQAQPQQYHAHQNIKPIENMVQYPASVEDNHPRYDQCQTSRPDYGQSPTHPSFQNNRQQLQQQQPQHNPPDLQTAPYIQQSNQHPPHQGQWQQQQQHPQLKSQWNHPSHNAIPSPPLVQRTQELAPAININNSNGGNQQQQQQQEGGCSPSYDSYNMPISMENNNNNNASSSQQQHQQQHLFQYQVYHPRELEQSGIIRNVGGGNGGSSASSLVHLRHPASQQQQCQQPLPPASTSTAAAISATNRLRSYESPSDEWHGNNMDGAGGGGYHSGMSTNNRVKTTSTSGIVGGNNGGQQQQMLHYKQSQSSQYYRQQQQMQMRPPGPFHPLSYSQHAQHQQAHPQQQQQQQQHGKNEQPMDEPMIDVGNNRGGVLKNNSSSTSPMDEQPKQQQQQQHLPLQSQTQTQTSNPQIPIPQVHNSHHPPNQPNWNDVNQLSRDDNRQRLYQRHLASRQKYHQQQQKQQQEEGGGQYLVQSQQHPTHQQQHAHPQQQQRPPTEPRVFSSRLSTLSPVEHLGNRTDHIQRKNKFVVLPPTSFGTSMSSSSLLRNNDASCGGASVVSEQARKFEEAALKQQQHLSRQRRIEQRKRIEDRWMNRRKDDSTTVSSQNRSAYRSQQQYLNESTGYHSDGGSLHHRQRNVQVERYTGGYQSDDQSIGSGRYHDAGYLSEGGGGRHYHRDEIQSHGVSVGGNYVDSNAITPQDARRLLWDENERLRAILPRHEIHRSNGNDTRDGRVPEQPQHAGFASPGNHSGSTSAGGGGGARFKSKFVHAAALAAQHEWNHSQKSQPMHREWMESGEERQRQQQHHPRDYTPTKKNATVLSHYTDSTAETTVDVTTIPGGSYGSSRNNSSRMAYSNDAAHRISLSPPRHLYKGSHDGHVGMPSIDEQGATPSLHLSEEPQNALSVANLIARINAVSRSNPEQALAAIDSIIKRESGGVDKTKNVRSSGTGFGKLATSVTQELAPSRANVITPSSEETNRGTLGEVRHLGKNFFQDKYEQILLSDSDKVIRTANVPGSRGNEEDTDDDDDDDDSLLSSDESTVSSMTDPTYQSAKPKSTAPKPTPTAISTKNRSSEHRSNQSTVQKEYDYPPVKPQKSWNTLKKEYNERKLSPSKHEESNTSLEKVVVPQSASNTEIKFSPEIEPHADGHHQEKRVYPDMTIMKLERNSTANGVAKNVTKSRSTSSQIGDLFGTANVERSHENTHSRGEASLKQGSKAVTQSRDSSDVKNKAKSQTSHQLPRQPSKGNALSTTMTPEVIRATKPSMRPDTPEIMMAVTNAFANVDISFAGAKTATSHPTTNTTAAAHSRPKDRPMPSLISPESDDGERTLKSFQTISDAFSDVDISFEQGKTVSQRRKELEYYSKSWTTSKSTTHASDDEQKQNPARQASKTNTAATTWAKSSLAKSRGNTTKDKKIVEPPLRLKGNKSLAQKFASLVKAFDD